MHFERTLFLLLIGFALTMATCLPNIATSAAFAAENDVANGESKSIDQWLESGHIGSGDWQIINGQLAVDSLDGLATVFFGQPEWQNYEITVTATFDEVKNPSRWLAIAFRAGENGTVPWSQFPVRFKSKSGSGTELAVLTPKGWKVLSQGKAAEDRKLGQPFTMRLVVRGTEAQGYLDGKQTVRSPFCLDRERGQVGLAVSEAKARFADLKIRRLPDTQPLSEKPVQSCEIVAHRGFSNLAPENTIVSGREAVRIGASGSECDLYATKDGHLVLMHDRMVNRTTDGEGKIVELTYDQVKKLDAGSWKDPKFAGEPVPTLEAYLAAMKDSGCVPVLEIKMTGISEKIIDAVRKADMVDQVAVLAFNTNVVREIRQLEPRIPCAWLAHKKLEGTAAQQADWIAEEAKKYDTDLVNLYYPMVSASIIEELHQRGIGVWVWTVNDPQIMETLMRWGIDSITTDRPDLAIEILKKHGEKVKGK